MLPFTTVYHAFAVCSGCVYGCCPVYALPLRIRYIAYVRCVYLPVPAFYGSHVCYPFAVDSFAVAHGYVLGLRLRGYAVGYAVTFALLGWFPRTVTGCYSCWLPFTVAVIYALRFSCGLRLVILFPVAQFWLHAGYLVLCCYRVFPLVGRVVTTLPRLHTRLVGWLHTTHGCYLFTLPVTYVTTHGLRTFTLTVTFPLRLIPHIHLVVHVGLHSLHAVTFAVGLPHTRFTPRSYTRARSTVYTRLRLVTFTFRLHVYRLRCGWLLPFFAAHTRLPVILRVSGLRTLRGLRTTGYTFALRCSLAVTHLTHGLRCRSRFTDTFCWICYARCYGCCCCYVWLIAFYICTFVTFPLLLRYGWFGLRVR